MRRLFLIYNSQNKDTIRLEVVSSVEISKMEVKCICSNTVKIKDYFGNCYNCGRGYGGPILER